MQQELLKENSNKNSLSLFDKSDTTSSKTNESVFAKPTIYKVKWAEDTIKIAKVFALQTLYAIVFILNALDIVLNPW